MSDGKTDPPRPASQIGHFIQTYSGFLGSFVIGLAGLIATSLWQFKQSEIAQHQAEAQQKVAETNAQNQWRIERAEILSKNLQVLAAHGGDTIEQRYGVLLSLTRGDILEPELAVSYALELGKDNPEYMRSVLANISEKNYFRLLSAFEPTCQQRFGVTRQVPLCKSDRNSERSAAVSELVADETEAELNNNHKGPLVLLKDERVVQMSLAKFAALFTPFLTELYDKRQWNEIERFEKYSPAAQLVSAVVLDSVPPGEFVSQDEAKTLGQFHADHAKFLSTYLFGSACNAECRGRVVDVILTSLGEAEGRYDGTLQALLKRPRPEVGPALARIQMRLLGCTVDSPDLRALRDRVLVPVLAEELQKPKPSGNLLEDVGALLALTNEPLEADKDAVAAYRAVLNKLRAQKDVYQKAFVTRRESAIRMRKNPPATLRKILFCNAAEVDALPADNVE